MNEFDLAGIFIIDFFDLCEILKVHVDYYATMKRARNESIEDFDKRCDSTKSLIKVLSGIVKTFQESKDIGSQVVTVTILRTGKN